MRGWTLLLWGGIQSSPIQSMGPASFGNQVITHIHISIPHTIINVRIFAHLSIFIIDLSTQVHAFIIDKSVLWFFAKVVVGLDDAENEQDKVSMLPSAEQEGKLKEGDLEVDDDEVRIIPTAEFTPKSRNPHKRQAKKLCAPLSAEFIRRSKHLSKDLDGFHNKDSKVAHVAGSTMKESSKGDA